MRLLILFQFAALFLLSCSNTQVKNNIQNTDAIIDTNQYAERFSILRYNGYTNVQVKNPWQKANEVVLNYYFVSNDSIQLPDVDPYYIIKTPVKRVVCLSTTHIAFIDCLGKTSSIIAISGKKLVSNKQITKGLQDGTIPDLGYDQSLNYELITKLKPDVVFAYGVTSNISGSLVKLRDLGIKVIIIAEYLETHPLAKAEWIKVFAECYHESTLAKKTFDSVSSQYIKLTKLTQNIKNKPKVMIGFPFNGTWYIAGGKSYMAKLINDAGGDFIWNNIDSYESVPVNWETVFEKSMYTDIWINIGDIHNKKEITSTDSRLASFNTFKNNNLYNNNALENNTGGNDYWESGVTNPHIILNDLIAILHPEITSGYNLHYYRKIN
jgi:iron complex transport system substrate-binding protein